MPLAFTGLLLLSVAPFVRDSEFRQELLDETFEDCPHNRLRSALEPVLEAERPVPLDDLAVELDA